MLFRVHQLRRNSNFQANKTMSMCKIVALYIFSGSVEGDLRSYLFLLPTAAISTRGRRPVSQRDNHHDHADLIPWEEKDSNGSNLIEKEGREEGGAICCCGVSGPMKRQKGLNALYIHICCWCLNNQ